MLTLSLYIFDIGSGLPVFDTIQKRLSSNCQGTNRSAIILEQKTDIFIPNFPRMITEIKKILDAKVELFQTTYSADHSIAINHYWIGDEKTPFLISYPTCDQETGVIKMVDRVHQEIFLYETILANNYIDVVDNCRINYQSIILAEEPIFDYVPSFLEEYHTLKYYLEQKKRENAGFDSGIIISTQTPELSEWFPRGGGTAFAIQQATGYPFIHMHRDGLARHEEMVSLRAIKNGSIVYITGHCNSGADTLAGIYFSSAPEGALIPTTPNVTDWSLEQYRDLILYNSTLQPGDTLTIVLWACLAGNNSECSTAAQLGRLFIEEGIRTEIIAATSRTLRFDGQISAESLQKNGIEFKMDAGYKSIRVFKCSEKGIIEYENKGTLSFCQNKLVGYNLASGRTIVNFPLEFQVVNNERYLATCKDSVFAERYLRDNPKEPYILHPSTKRIDAALLVFTLSFYTPNIPECSHIRFFIDSGELYSEIFGRTSQVSLRGRNLDVALQEVMRSTILLILKKNEKQGPVPVIRVLTPLAEVPLTSLEVDPQISAPVETTHCVSLASPVSHSKHLSLPGVKKNDGRFFMIQQSWTLTQQAGESDCKFRSSDV